MELHHNKFITLKSSLLYSVGLGTVLGVPSAPYLGKFLPQTMYNQYIDLYGFFDGSLLYQCSEVILSSWGIGYLNCSV